MIQKFRFLLASNGFFYGIIGLLSLQALWIALSGRYPMAFDEDFHLGIIRLYAHHISPFWSAQPPNADMFGAVYRDPSYLYHYLMSFPYRLISIFTHDQTIQVLILRFINIGLFACGLPLYRRLLSKVGASRGLIHILLLAFVLLPLVPFLAAQINYDNLFIPLVALSLLLTIRVNEELRLHKRIPMVALLELIIVALLTSIVKYAYLPVLITIGAFLAVQCYRYLGRKKKFWITVGFGLTLIGKRLRLVLLVAVLISAALFVERYGVNLVRYHEAVPNCDQILTVQRCNAYGPYQRDYNYALQKNGDLNGPVGFTWDWLYGMWLRTFFAVDGPGTSFETRSPLVGPGIAGIALPALGILALLWKARAVLRRHDNSVLALFAAVVACYVALLWLDEYKAYLHAGQPVAINGRYLLPILPLFMVLLGLGCSELFRKRSRLQALLAGISILALLWGGGALTFIIRSRAAWYWPNHYVVTANKSMQNALYPIVPGAKSPTQFLR